MQKGVILNAFAVDDEGNGIDGDVNEVKLRVLDLLGRHSLQWTLDRGVATTVISTNVSLAIVMPQEKRIAKAVEMRGKPGWTPAMEKVYQDIQNTNSIGWANRTRCVSWAATTIQTWRAPR